MSLTNRVVSAFSRSRRKKQKHAEVEQATARTGEKRDVKLPKDG